MEKFKKEIKEDIRVMFITLLIVSVLYVQGLGIQFLLEALGINF